MEIKCKTNWKPVSTKIQFGTDFVLKERLPKLIAGEERRVALITDLHLEKIYGAELDKLDCTRFYFEAGEAFKTRETKQMLEDNLLSHNFGRDSLLVGLGGGVSLDLTGFVAATYCRGIPYIQIPTSLLGMVDASIGGKTAVNSPYGKNMIGAFHPPSQVWIDGRFLRSLPKGEWINGIVEIMKAGLIVSPPLFQAMKEGKDLWYDEAFMMDRVYESVLIKKEVVEEDPEEERGYRRILNLGHTLGHALETLEEFRIPHGIAVAIGLLVSGYLSVQMKLLPIESFQEICELFSLLPLHLSKEHSIEDLFSVMVRDKKSVKATPRFVLLRQIGLVEPFDGEYCTEVEFPLLEQGIEWMHGQFCR